MRPILITAVLLLSLTACNRDKAQGQQQPQTAATPPPSAQQAPPTVSAAVPADCDPARDTSQMTPEEKRMHDERCAPGATPPPTDGTSPSGAASGSAPPAATTTPAPPKP
jgi:hypothetical protein